MLGPANRACTAAWTQLRARPSPLTSPLRCTLADWRSARVPQRRTAMESPLRQVAPSLASESRALVRFAYPLCNLGTPNRLQRQPARSSRYRTLPPYYAARLKNCHQRRPPCEGIQVCGSRTRRHPKPGPRVSRSKSFPRSPVKMTIATSESPAWRLRYMF